MIQNHKRLQRKPSRKNRQVRTRPIAMEQLEDRRVLATFGVTTLLDTLDAEPGDGLAEDSSGETSLRAAVMEANALGGAHTINLGAGTYGLSLAGGDDSKDPYLEAVGDLDVRSDLTIQGIDKSTSIIDGLQLDRIIDVHDGGSLTLNNVSLINGFSPSVGGAIYSRGDLSITDTIFSDNESRSGGGAIEIRGSLPTIASFTRTIFERNLTHSGNRGSGAILNQTATMTIVDSQFIDNTGLGVGAGAIHTFEDTTIIGSLFIGNQSSYQGGAIRSDTNLEITNSTFTQNSADGNGGAISASPWDTSKFLKLTNVTIVDNHANDGGGGVYLSSRGNYIYQNTEIHNSIIALNNAGFTYGQDLEDYRAEYTSLGGNIIGNVTGARWNSSLPETDIIGNHNSPVDPFLDSLADNGGPTKTMALLPISPAIDAGLLTGAPSVDQRGIARPQGSGIDIGAYEFVTVTDPNTTPPTATDNLETTLEDTPLIGQMLGADLDGDTLYFSVIDQPSKGQLEWSINGSYTYTPNQDVYGDDSFTYRVFTIDGTSDLATVNIEVAPVNDRPTASSMSFYPTEDTTFYGQLAAHDIDSPPPKYLQKSSPDNGTLIFNENGSFEYTPNANYDGSDSFSWSAVDDGQRGTGIKNAYFYIQGVNDPPITEDSFETLLEDKQFTGNMIGSDPDGDALRFQEVSQPAHGHLNWSIDGSYKYIPDVNYFGSDSFNFRVSTTYGTEVSESSTVHFNVIPINDNPRAATMGFMTDEETPFTNSLMATDVDNSQEELQFIIVDQPLHGNLVLSQTVNGEITYTPETDFFGEDTFTYKVYDGISNSGITLARIQVNNINDAPVADTIFMDPTEDILFSNNVSATDVDEDSFTFESVSEPTHGTLTFESDGSFTYLPDLNYDEDDEFTYRAYDGELYSEPASIFLNVNPVNDAPTLVDAVFAVDENTAPGTIIGTLTASDIEDAAEELEFSMTGGSALGIFGVFNTGKVFVRSNAVLDYETTSSYELEVQVRDSEWAYSTTALITFTINDLFWVDINIVPNDYTNTAKLDSSIKVAILSNPEFDAVNDLDAASLTFGITGTESSLKLHKKHGTPQVTYSDVNGDGLLDAVVTFDMRLTGLKLGDTSATLRGTLLSSGEEFEVTDSILISEGKGGGGGGGGNGNNGGGKGGGKKNR